MWPQWPCPPCFMGALGIPPGGLPLHRAGWPWKGIHLSSVLWDRPLTLLCSRRSPLDLPFCWREHSFQEPSLRDILEQTIKSTTVRAHSLPTLTFRTAQRALPAVGRAHSLWGHTGPVVLGITRAGSGSQWGLSGDKVPQPGRVSPHMWASAQGTDNNTVWKNRFTVISPTP